MEFNLINLVGGIIVAVMLIPNILYALRFPDSENKCKNKMMNLLEQLGRYGSMALMVLPLGVWEFGFPNVASMLVYLTGNGVMLAVYLGVWVMYFRNQTRNRALILAVVPTGIFLFSGFMLRHLPLILAGAVFGVAHICVTWENNK